MQKEGGGAIDRIEIDAYSTFEENYAVSSSFHGGGTLLGCSLFLSNSTFRGNYVLNDPAGRNDLLVGGGGAIFISNANICSSCKREDCTFSNNSAVSGGIPSVISDSKPRIENVIMKNNTAIEMRYS